MESHSGNSTKVYWTAKGVRYRIKAARLAELTAQVSAPAGLSTVLRAAAVPVLLVLTALIVQMIAAGDGQELIRNSSILLLFGCSLGLNLGPLAVAAVFFAGGVVGGAFGLVLAPAGWSGLQLGCMTGIHAVMASSMLLAPRLTHRDGWVPWGLLLGYATLAGTVLLHGPGVAGGHLGHAGLISGVLAGLAVALMLVDYRDRNHYRLSAVFLLLAGSMVVRLTTHACGLLQGAEGAASIGAVARVALDLLFLFVGTLYVMVHSEVVLDRTRFEHRRRLDELVAGE